MKKRTKKKSFYSNLADTARIVLVLFIVPVTSSIIAADIMADKTLMCKENLEILKTQYDAKFEEVEQENQYLNEEVQGYSRRHSF